MQRQAVEIKLRQPEDGLTWETRPVLRMFDALLELNSGRYKHQYNDIIKWFGDSIRKYAICFLAPTFHAGDLEPIANALAREGLEITTHTIEPVPDNKLSVFVWIRGIGEEVNCE